MRFDERAVVYHSYLLSRLVNHQEVFRDPCEHKGLVADKSMSKVCLNQIFKVVRVSRQHHLSNSLKPEVDGSVDFETEATKFLHHFDLRARTSIHWARKLPSVSQTIHSKVAHNLVERLDLSSGRDSRAVKVSDLRLDLHC
jgi:hypothetical protein